MEPLTSFHLVSLDLLKLIAHKRANNQTREADILQNFYDCVLSITTKSSEELHMLRLKVITEHYKAKILEMEMKQVYNDIFKLHSPLAIELIQKSVMPTKKQFEEEVIIKNS